MIRPSRDAYFMRMAQLVSTRATCLRRSVGCVLVNARGHVLATGYNGVAAGMPHCNEPMRFLKGPGIPETTIYPDACAGAAAPSGDSLDACQAIHAEQNALLQCRDVYEIEAAYCTTAPCVTCAKLLLGTSCHRVVFSESYPHELPAAKLWRRGRRTWEKFE